MAYTRTISITNMDLALKLSQEDNISGFIQTLLEKHYENKVVKELSLKQKQALLELAKKQEEIDKQEEIILNGN